VLRKNSRLRSVLGKAGTDYLTHGLRSFERLLPHTELGNIVETDALSTKATWNSPKRKSVNLYIDLAGAENNNRGIQLSVQRKGLPKRSVEPNWLTMDEREHHIAKLVVDQISSTLRPMTGSTQPASLRAIADRFDEQLVASYLHQGMSVGFDLADLFGVLRSMSGQTYENSSIAFGCRIDKRGGSGPSIFPRELLNSKKYKALTDGYNTCYSISSSGQMKGIISMARGKNGMGKKFYPLWCEAIAGESLTAEMSLALTKQGDILVFRSGNMEFTYRFGQWQGWAHEALARLIAGLLRGKGASAPVIGKTARYLYRAAIDASFRRKGALFVVLSNRRHIDNVARPEDQLEGHRRTLDAALDQTLRGRLLPSLPRQVVADLASLDGAIVVDKKGQLLAYGAVLQPRRKGNLKGSEGSRTKAAVGASNYGTAIKVSSDGGISIYHKGKKFLTV
jgi:hypothetical protein